MQSLVHPLVQMHIPEGFLDPVEDKRPKTTEEEHLQKVEKTVLPKPKVACLAHEPKNGPTRILTAVVWLKLRHKYFNQGMAKEACKLFTCMQNNSPGSSPVESTLVVETPVKGTGPKTRGKKRKSVPLVGAVKKAKSEEEKEEDHNDNNNNTTQQKVKDRPH